MSESSSLINKLKTEEDEDDRCFAAQDLAEYGEETGVVDALVQALQSDECRGVQEAACSALVQINNDQVSRQAARLMAEEDAYVRNAASDILAESKNVPDELFAEMLMNDDPDLRIFATVTIDNRRVRSLLPMLVELLEKDAEINVVSAAINALGNLGCRDVRDDGSSDVDALLTAGRRFPNEPFITFAVNAAISQIEDEAAAG
ncbi:MAG: HEAT repeat domain-containing protein [Mariprofundales bacterium]|nr:HEAT repeat domain-containing protein [Mariprofundales bacterium]